MPNGDELAFEVPAQTPSCADQDYLLHHVLKASDMSKWIVPELYASLPALSVSCIAPGRPDNWIPFLYTSPGEYPHADTNYLRSHKDDDGNHAAVKAEPRAAGAPALTIVGGSAMISAMLLLAVVARRSKTFGARLV